MSVVRIAAIVCVVSLAMAAGPAAGGQDDDQWPVKGKLIGKTKKSGEVSKSKDVSGIACTTDTGFPRDCLVIDDNLQFAQFVTVKDGKIAESWNSFDFMTMFQQIGAISFPVK